MKRHAKSLLTLTGLLLSAGCSNESPGPPLIIASDATFAPFHWREESGEVTGFDIELARAVALQAVFSPEVVVLPYDDLFSGLITNSHDVVAATTGITTEREQVYLFSEPYYETCQVAVVRVGPGEPATVADLDGARIGAAGAGTSVKAMKTISGVLIKLDSGEGVPSLDARVVDAWIVDEFDGVAAARASSGRLRVLAEPVATERYGFVLGPDQNELKSRLDSSLAGLRRDGTVARLRTEFGVERGPDWPVDCAAAVNRPKNQP
jgi:ABC-type amino acid transport substrate-binding protein